MPLTEANTVAVQPQQDNTGNQNANANAGVHQVDNFYGPGLAGRNEYKEHDQAYVVFENQSNDKQSLYERTMEVNAVMPVVPKLIYLSDQAMGWDISDHPKVMPNSSGYVLAMDPTLVGPGNNVKFSKVLIKNGSSINIMYQDTMHKLGIKDNMLEPSKTTLHGIVSGLSCLPMGKIRLDIMFGHRDNCQVENLQFKVMDLETPYHALLGRPALARFMDNMHVAYLNMKMPGPRGVITIIGDYKHSMVCASARSSLAETLIIAEEKKRLKRAVEISEIVAASMPGMTNPHGTTSFQVAKETKKVALDDAFPERRALIGAGLNPK
jgi:hypothetical protein